MAPPMKFRPDRLVGSVKIMLEQARKAGRNEFVIDLAPLQALTDLAEGAVRKMGDG